MKTKNKFKLKTSNKFKKNENVILLKILIY